MNNRLLITGVLSITAIAVTFAAYQNGVFAKVNSPNVPTEVELPFPKPPIETPPLSQRPKVELVFALDTTGSMSGLINAAKEKIWSIATTMAQAQPAPEISIGLVAYRDRGDAYVTKHVPLSQDLDEVYAKLLDFEAAGGGDEPESVNAALYDAVNTMNWSQDPNSYKVVFLVGDAPGHQNYPYDIPYTHTAKIALEKGIIINTIQAGNSPAMITEWDKIASLGQGDTFQVDQQGSSLATSTPFDEEIAAVAANYEDTRIYYGSEAEQKEQTDRVAITGSRIKRTASEASQARRAKYNLSKSGERNFVGKNELLFAIENDELSLEEIPETELPSEMRAMSVAEQKAFVVNKMKERKQSKQKLLELTRQRDEYIKSKISKDDKAKSSLDEQLYATLKKQAEKKGIDYSDSESSY